MTCNLFYNENLNILSNIRFIILSATPPCTVLWYGHTPLYIRLGHTLFAWHFPRTFIYFSVFFKIHFIALIWIPFNQESEHNLHPHRIQCGLLFLISYAQGVEKGLITCLLFGNAVNYYNPVQLVKACVCICAMCVFECIRLTPRRYMPRHNFTLILTYYKYALESRK